MPWLGSQLAMVKYLAGYQSAKAEKQKQNPDEKTGP